MPAKHLAIALLFAGHLTTASADVPFEQRHEVEHLLNFIANTPCTINRNGSLHNGPEALAHIKKKYAYYRDDIFSTEQFIELSASQSTFSGKAYTVRCGNGKTVITRQWLLAALAKYRSQKALKKQE